MSAMAVSYDAAFEDTASERARFHGPVLGGAGLPGATAPRAGLHLTRRGRLVFFGIPVVVVLSLLAVAAAIVLVTPLTSAARATDSVVSAGHSISVTVKSGETLWDIAERVAPNQDPRQTVRDIAELNDLQTSVIHAGERLSVPVR